MTDASIPFVAVIGGLRPLDSDPASKAAAQQTGKIIGAALAKAGFGLVVYYSDAESLEPYVVSGYVAANPSGNELIRVRYANSQVGQVRFAEQTARPELFKEDLLPDDDWEVPFYQSLAAAGGVDAVVLLSGNNAVLIAGQVALARRLPILAVNRYKGSAEKVWKQLRYAGKQVPPWDDRSADTLVAALKLECVEAANRKDEERSKAAHDVATIVALQSQIARFQSQNLRTGYALGAFALFILATVYTIAFAETVSHYKVTLFVTLITAGATGALMRGIWKPVETRPLVALALGSFAGFVVGISYLIPQWTGTGGVLDPKVTTISLTENLQLISAVIIAIAGGLGFDTILNRIEKQAADASVGPPKP
jgi:hypothetical protein